MIFDNIKDPHKNYGAEEKSGTSPEFQQCLNELCEREIMAPQEAVTAYLALLKGERFTRPQEHQKIIFHLAACLERTGDLGRALYYLALCPYYYPCLPGAKEEDRLRVYKTILMHKAFEKFSRNKQRFRVLVADPLLPRLNFIVDTIEKACYQKVFATESKERFDAVKSSSFIQEFELVLLSSDLFVTSAQINSEYAKLKNQAYSPFVSFMLPAEEIPVFRKEYPGIEYVLVNDNLKFLYAVLLFILQKNI